jgi:hypothetical protein
MDSVLAHLLDAAGRAPSAHNTQPWVLRPRGSDELEVSVRAGRTLPAADPTGADTLHSLGAMLENLLITLAHLGCAAEYEVMGPVAPEAPVLRIRWRPAGRSPSVRDRNGDPAALYRMIPIRRTSRLRYDAAPIAPEILAALRAAVRPPGALYVLTEARAIAEVRALVAAATAEQLADAPVARELYGWLRFSPRDRRWYRDGLNAACMGWRSWEAAAIRLLLAPSVLPFLSRWGLHRALCADVDQQAPPAPAICLLTVEEESVAARIEAGRILQRLWLTAALHGLVTHPLSAAVDVTSTRPRVLERFGVPAGQSHVNLFRLGRSAPPARSSRLPADEILDAPD